jgi:hypothetical protein
MVATQDSITDKFFNLLRIAVGQNLGDEIKIDDSEWSSLFEMACKQSLVGLILKSLDELNE